MRVMSSSPAVSERNIFIRGRSKILPYSEVFQRTWNLELEGVGSDGSAYPNRDSLKYRSLFGLDQIETMIRGTLRYPGWSEPGHASCFLV